MSASIFSPNGNNFCKFMTPNFPKPMFLDQIHLGLVGTCPMSLDQGHARTLGPILGALGPRLGGACGPWRPKADFLGVRGRSPWEFAADYLPYFPGRDLTHIPWGCIIR